MSKFDAYRGAKRRRGGSCAVCSKPVEGRVVISLQAKERVEGRTSKDANANRYPNIDATSASFCEDHAVEIYEAAKKAMPA